MKIKNDTNQKEQIFYKIYPLKTYNINQKFIDTMGQDYEKDELVEILGSCDEGYHTRINSESNYKFFGDCDNYRGTFSNFAKMLRKFLEIRYELIVNNNDISYTENKNKKGSYHYVIPNYFASCKKLKEIHSNFLKEYKDEFIYRGENKTEKVVDTTIYSNHWFRYPNQSKEGKSNTKHVVIQGKMEDFILEYIAKNSVCIDNTKYIDTNINVVTPVKKLIKQSSGNNTDKVTVSKINNMMMDVQVVKNNTSNTKEQIIKNIEWTIFYEFFDKCYKQERFETYDNWIKVGMGIYNRYGEYGFELFKYFSNKAKNPDNENNLKEKYNSFKNNIDNPITIKSLYHFAKEDNKEKFVDIIRNKSFFKDFYLTSTDVAKYIKQLKPNYFIWKNKILYCFNGKFWVKNDIPLKIYISNELYEFLKEILVICFWGDPQFEKHRRALENLKGMQFKKEIIETTEEYLTNNSIEFDSKFHLFGFDNVVYDLKENIFREYRYDDFISTTTGYEWFEPGKDKVDKMIYLLEKIFPIENERKLLLQILASGLEGRAVEKLFLFNGGGRNGKGFVNDVYLKSLGTYGFIANSAILFEKNRTGSNPEKNNLHKKRYVIFREPPKESKLENSVIKELTGGGKFSARGHHESGTEKTLHITMVIECNARPLFAEDPKKAEIDRLVDILFGSTFTDNIKEVDHSKHIYEANVEYKTEEFQNAHKTALLKIVFDEYKNYAKNNYKFDIPQSIRDRTNEYLEMSCNILTWINDNYEKTDSKKDIIKLKDVYDRFKCSEYYHNLTKMQKRTYNKNYFVKEISENIFFKKYYRDRCENYTSVLIYYKEIDEDHDCD